MVQLDPSRRSRTRLVHPPNEAFAAHFKYYQKLRGQVKLLLGKEPPELKKYSDRYERELLTLPYRALDYKDFFESIARYEVILVGDFHAQKQSARSLLRICRKMGAGKVVLALECFRAEDQKHLDAYADGKLSEKEFLKKIQWDSTWGFPWENTKPLVRWAISNRVHLYGINLLGPRLTLKKRDQYAAKIIRQIVLKHKTKTVVVQIGDFHLPKRNLPSEIKRAGLPTEIGIVYQSPDSIYFKLDREGKKVSDFYSLGSHTWAMMTIVPWVKWQDYLLHLESGFDQSIQTDELDSTDHVVRFIELIAGSLKLDLGTNQFAVFPAQDEKLRETLKVLPLKVRKQIYSMVEEGYSFCVPEAELCILNRITVNHMSRVAAQYILGQLKIMTSTLQTGEGDFLKLIWVEMLTYFLVKAANPKRKSDTMKDIRAALARSKISDRGRESLALALEQKMKEIKYINSGELARVPQRHLRNKKTKRLRHSSSYAVAATILGGVLGEKVFYAYQKKLVSAAQIKSVLFRPIDEKKFEARYYEIIETIDSWPAPFKSKYDQF